MKALSFFGCSDKGFVPPAAGALAAPRPQAIPTYPLCNVRDRFSVANLGLSLIFVSPDVLTLSAKEPVRKLAFVDK